MTGHEIFMLGMAVAIALLARKLRELEEDIEMIGRERDEEGY